MEEYRNVMVYGNTVVDTVSYACRTGDWFSCNPWYVQFLIFAVAVVLGVALFLGFLWMTFEGPGKLRTWWQKPVIEAIEKKGKKK